MGIIFRQLKDPTTSTYTYIIGDSITKEVAIIDSVRENVNEYKELLFKNDWNLKYLIETHTHADHITAILQLKKHFPFSEVIVGKLSEATYEVSRVTDKDSRKIGGYTIQFFETPGHTKDSVSILFDNNRLMTGDCLFIGSCGRTDFQQGSIEEMYSSLKKIMNLHEDTLIYPGHDYNNRFVSNIKEEKLLNKMIKLTNYDDFEKELNSWNLPPPKKISESVPANILGGLE
jgi:glyoxylase-like metal-dependent hydrolase (beta-lactamase superfamily II)